ncbi:helix-turn-helix domain-containing protein [Paenibacillus woosongensis]|nr:helix-turn-helix transcriptional regulator [Paenibacillus woosongensis]
MSSNEFGKHLKTARESKKMTLEVLGTKVNLSKSYLSHIENGRREPPSPEILRKLAEALGISYEELMIKAGYWNERHTSEDKILFEEINNERWKDFERTTEVLKALSDDDGYFPDYLHDDIFRIFGGHLLLSEGNDSAHDFNKFYEDEYLKRPDYYVDEGLNDEICERFNRVYNYTAIKNALPKYRGEKDFLGELISIADKHGIVIGEKKTNFTIIDLSEALPDRSIIIRFNNRLISQKSRHKLMGYLEALSTIDEIIGDDSQ